MIKSKILFLINKAGYGGAEKVFVEDCTALQKSGYMAEIYYLYPNNFKSIYDISGYKKLFQKIKNEKIGIVYSTLDDANFVAKVLRLFADFKLFCREANMTEDKPFKFKLADILLNHLVYRLVMVAEAVRYSYASYDVFHKNKMIVLHNGVLPVEKKSNTDTRNPIKIIAVGSFTPKKGFLELLDIIKVVSIKNPNFYLEIIGDGILYKSVKEKVQSLGLSKLVQTPGLLLGEDLEKKYLEANIFVLTSKKEGCPNVLLEAMNYGLVPVSFAVGAVSEIIEDKISGIVVPKEDQAHFSQRLIELLNNPEKIKEISNAAIKRIEEKFSFEFHLRNLIKTLEL